MEDLRMVSGDGWIRNAGRIAVLALACDGLLVPPPAHAWLFTLDGPSAISVPEEVDSVAVTPGGDVVAAGMTINSGYDTDLTVVKLAGVGGAVLWTTVVDGSMGATDQPRQVLVDTAGDVLVGGTLQTTGDPRTLAVLKLSGADGSELWRHLISVPLNPFTAIGAIALDPAGDVVTVGTAVNAGNGSTDFAVFKLSGADGSQLWSYTLDGSAHQGDYATVVALDATGDVFAGGTTNDLVTGDDFAVVKLAGTTGAELWRRSIDGSARDGDYLRAIAVDAGQDVVVAGSMVRAGLGEDLAVVKLAGVTGADVWQQFADGSAHDSDVASALAIDGKGDVVVAGAVLDHRTGRDFAVLKLRGRTGRRRWFRKIDGGLQLDDTGVAVAVDAAGRVAVGGTTRTPTGARFTVVRLTSRGGRRWRRDLVDSAASYDSGALALTFDGNGDVVAGGSTSNTETGDDLTVAKFLGPSGADAP